MIIKKCFPRILYVLVILVSMMLNLSPVIALGLGILFSLLQLKEERISQHVSLLLKISIILLGFGMSLTQVLQASSSGFLYTTLSVIFVMSFGLLLGKLLEIEKDITLLIASGTAICGGSAIMAVSSTIGAKNYQISFALAVIFVLNAVALLIFPPLGHYFNMSQEHFGTWAAIAIQDTSSVVGAGSIYGNKALEIATTVKLIRALWIIPLSIFIAIFNKNEPEKKIKIPWFIFLFVLSIMASYYFPKLNYFFKDLYWVGKKGMWVALFLIGTNISIAEIKKAGFKSFVLGILLWLLIGISSFILLA